MKLAWRLHQNPIYDSATPLYLDLSERFELRAAQFETVAQGGFGTATLDIAKPTEADARNARNWFMKWLRVTAPGGQICYEGIVAEVHAHVGYHQYHLVINQFANRLYAEYIWAGSYAGVGKCPKNQKCKGRAVSVESDVATTTTTSEWGIKEHWLDLTSVGVMAPERAELEADKELKKKLRAYSVQIASGDDMPDATIRLVVWGPYQTLGFRKQTAQYKTETEIATIVSGALTVGSKAQYINTSDTSQIATTGNPTIFNPDANPQWINDYIQGAISEGDSNGRDLFFQVWENRRPFLVARSNSIAYSHRSDEDRFYGVNRAVVPKYLVRAGGLLLAENADLGIGNYADYLDRPSVSLIETTTYDDVRESLNIPINASNAITAERVFAKLLNRYRGNF